MLKNLGFFNKGKKLELDRVLEMATSTLKETAENFKTSEGNSSEISDHDFNLLISRSLGGHSRYFSGEGLSILKSFGKFMFRAASSLTTEEYRKFVEAVKQSPSINRIPMFTLIMGELTNDSKENICRFLSIHLHKDPQVVHNLLVRSTFDSATPDQIEAMIPLVTGLAFMLFEGINSSEIETSFFLPFTVFPGYPLFQLMMEVGNMVYGSNTFRTYYAAK